MMVSNPTMCQRTCVGRSLPVADSRWLSPGDEALIDISLAASIGGAASAHVVTLSGDKACLVRGQEVNDRCYLFRAPQATHRDLAGQLFNLLRRELSQKGCLD